MGSEFNADWFDENFYRGGKGSIRDKESPFYRMFVNRVIETFGEEEYKGLQLLDCGCGLGIRTNIYICQGFDAFGIDISKWAHENHVLEEGHHECVDLRWIPDGLFGIEKFDLLSVERVMGYIPKRDAQKVVKNLVKLTKKNIIFSIICSDHSGSEAVLRGSPGRINIAPKKFWLEIFKKAGLIVNGEKTAIMCKSDWDCVWFLEKENVS